MVGSGGGNKLVVTAHVTRRMQTLQIEEGAGKIRASWTLFHSSKFRQNSCQITPSKNILNYIEILEDDDMKDGSSRYLLK